MRFMRLSCLLYPARNPRREAQSPKQPAEINRVPSPPPPSVPPSGAQPLRKYKPLPTCCWHRYTLLHTTIVSFTSGISLHSLGCKLTLALLTRRIWRAPNNASKWQMGFNPVFRGLSQSTMLYSAVPLNPYLGTKWDTRQCYVFHGDIWIEKTSFNPFLGKAEIQSRNSFEKLWVVYLWSRGVLISP